MQSIAFYCGEMGRSDACKTRWGNCGEMESAMCFDSGEEARVKRGKRRKLKRVQSFPTFLIVDIFHSVVNLHLRQSE
jgi:hypothetical protein